MDIPTRHPAELEAALQRLFHRNIHLIKLDLEPMQALMELLGNPQHSFICVHVAGTNGKGSVCAMLSSILRCQGYQTGLYTSPHLVSFNERIQMNGEPVSDDTLIALISEVESAAAQLASRGFRDVTFFEFTTAIAFLYFQRNKVEVAVIETGMGGRLDATNVVIPAVSIITSIGLEHTAYLGDTIEKIAAEKAGIIKPGRPVIIGPLAEEAQRVISVKAREIHAPLYVAEDQVSVTVRSLNWEGQTMQIASEHVSYGSVKSSLPGKHQAANTAIAVAAAECLNNLVGVTISDDAVKKGIAATQWPARGQLISKSPPIILDGAHNLEAAAALAEWVKKVGEKKPLGLVVGFLSDKDPAAFMRTFSGRARKVWIVPIHSDRAMPVNDIMHRLSFMPRVESMPDLNAALAIARAWAESEDGIIIITGSLYLAGEVLASRP